MANTQIFPFRSAAFAGLLFAAALGLRAQSTDVAPGVGEPATVSLVANDDFSAASQNTAWPDGWSRDAAQPVTWEKEGDTRFLRLASQREGQLVQVARTIPVPADVKGLVVAVRFRIANFKFGTNGAGAPSFTKDIRFSYKFLDAAGAPVARASGSMVLDSHAKNWTDVSRRFLVPEGAVTLQLIPAINEAKSGTLDVARVTLAPMSDSEVDAIAQAPALAAKQKTEDETEIQKMLMLPPKTGGLKVSGNKLVNDQGRQVILQGVNIPSLEWSAKGESILRSAKVALIDWKANVLRVPVHNGYWFGRGKGAKEKSNDAEAYRAIVDDLVKFAAGQGAYVILDLHLFGGPQADAVEFWKNAAARYKNNPAVLFDLFNEPTGITWDLWQKGGPREVKDKKTGETSVVQVVGMQALIDAARSTGAKNIVIAGGIGYAYDLGGVLEGRALNEGGGNGLVYATHFYNWHRGWEKKFLAVAAKYPVLVGEFGADVRKMSFVPANQQEDPFTWMPDALGMIQKYQLNWTAFSLHPKATPVLIKDWTYEPTPFFGVFVKDALAGKKFEMKKMR
jgi:endoglucanase